MISHRCTQMNADGKKDGAGACVWLLPRQAASQPTHNRLPDAVASWAAFGRPPPRRSSREEVPHTKFTRRRRACPPRRATKKTRGLLPSPLGGFVASCEHCSSPVLLLLRRGGRRGPSRAWGAERSPGEVSCVRRPELVPASRKAAAPPPCPPLCISVCSVSSVVKMPHLSSSVFICG
jgi:hypothetical protein